MYLEAGERSFSVWVLAASMGLCVSGGPLKAASVGRGASHHGSGSGEHVRDPVWGDGQRKDHPGASVPL